MICHCNTENCDVAKHCQVERMKMNLATISTKDLVIELKNRLGVDVQYADPYEDISLSVNGPATVLIVTD